MPGLKINADVIFIFLEHLWALSIDTPVFSDSESEIIPNQKLSLIDFDSCQFKPSVKSLELQVGHVIDYGYFHTQQG